MKYDTVQLFIRNLKFDIRNSRVCEAGFTLIELLIVISIIGLLTTFTIAAYTNFNKSQQYTSTVNDVINILQVARSRASSQYAPSTLCDQTNPGLLDYRVDTTTASGVTQIFLKVNCNPPGLIVPQVKTYSSITVPSSVGVTFTTSPPSSPIVFYVQGATAATPATIAVVQTPQSKTIGIETSGRIVSN